MIINSVEKGGLKPMPMKKKMQIVFIMSKILLYLYPIQYV